MRISARMPRQNKILSDWHLDGNAIYDISLAHKVFMEGGRCEFNATVPCGNIGCQCYAAVKNAAAKTEISIKMLSAKTGSVYFVGRAARLVTSAIAIAAVASINNAKGAPVASTAIVVMGVRMQP